MLLVTGGAGFIGSNIVAALNDGGRPDVVVCDWLGQDGKWRNLAKRQLVDIVPPGELMTWLDGRKLDAVIHMGAISATTATDGDEVFETNFRFSMRLLDWCTQTGTPLIYASSAATYGEGEHGFVDSATLPALRQLRPMNLYGWSKHMFDLAVAQRRADGQPLPPQCVGLKFFNVFGPNEYHKGTMMSVLTKRFDEIRAGTPIELFKSHREGIADGDQRRDFIYVDDIVRVVLWLLATPVGKRAVQRWDRPGAQFQGHDAGCLCGARQSTQYRICRYARRDSRELSVFYAKRRYAFASCWLQWWFYFAGRRRDDLRQGLFEPT